MNRSMVAALIFLSLLLPAFAQHGGGHGGGFSGGGGRGFSGGGGFASHGFSGGRSFGGGMSGGMHRPGFASGGGNVFARGGHHTYNYRSYSRYGYGRAGYYPYGYGYGLPRYGYANYGFAPSYDPSAYYEDPGDPQVYAQQQQEDIDRLENEVAQLRAERGQQAAANQNDAPGSHPVSASAPESAVLVYRDQHSEEIENYAIMGKTVYVFNDAHAKRVSIAALDVPATEKANQERGVDFRLPQ